MRTSTVRLAREELKIYAKRYSYGTPDYPDPWSVGDHRKFLTFEEFYSIGVWKSPRSKKLLEGNTEDAVLETTRLALAQESDRLSVHILMALRGVGMPIASAILHWTHRKPFPILDFRAVWSLGIEMPPEYSLAFWDDYVHRSRDLATLWGCSMRELDMALWQYSKENQGKAPQPLWPLEPSPEPTPTQR